jgi:hypothetical protein
VSDGESRITIYPRLPRETSRKTCSATRDGRPNGLAGALAWLGLAWWSYGVDPF